jgi:tetratricopeptide (TPR) repeat protein
VSGGGLDRLLRQLAEPGVDIDAKAALDEARERLLGATPRRPMLDRYELGVAIGRGGSGVVYRARDPALGRDVAIKLLATPTSWGSSSARLVREARALATLSHPNVVAVHDVGTYDLAALGASLRECGSAAAVDDTGVYMVMELLTGVSLAVWIVQPRPWREVVEVFAAAGRGLAAAHDRGLVHRDFKPSNVIVRDDGRACVLDFGLVEARAQDTDAVIDDTFSTAEGMVLGTPAYMAPEQHRDGDVDARCDQYAFCVSLWQALFGSPPFAGRTVDALVSAKRRGPPAVPRRPAIPRRIRNALYRGLAARPSDRFTDMRALLEQLAPPRRAWWVPATITVGVATTAIVLGRPEPTPCDDIAAAADLGWDRDRAQDVRAAFERNGAGYAATALGSVEADLTRYASQWREIRSEVCRTGDDDPVARLQLQCLDRAALDVRAFAERLAFADDTTVEHTASGLAALPRLDECRDGSLLSRLAPEPPPHEIADEVAQLRAGLAQVRALGLAGRVEEAKAELAGVEARAEGIDHPPVLAEIALARGEAEIRASHEIEAERSLREVLRLVAIVPHPKVEAAAWAGLLHAVGVGRRQTEDIAWMIDLARTHHAAIGSPPRLGAQLSNTIASIHAAQNHPEEGVAELDRAIERAERDGPADLYAPLVAARGMLRRRAGDTQGALMDFETSIALLETQLGPDHPQLTAPLTNAANVYGDLDQLERSDALLDRAIAISTRAHGSDNLLVGRIRSNRAAYYYRQHRYDEALREAQAARDLVARAAGPDGIGLAAAEHVLGLAYLGLERYEEALAKFEHSLALPSRDRRLHDVVNTHLNAGLALAGLDRLDEARARLDTARAIGERDLGLDHARTIAVLREIGKLELERGRVADAQAVLEEALVRAERSRLQAGDHARVRLALAKVLQASGAPEPRWRAMATSARELLLALAGSDGRAEALGGAALSALHRELLDEIEALL